MAAPMAIPAVAPGDSFDDEEDGGEDEDEDGGVVVEDSIVDVDDDAEEVVVIANEEEVLDEEAEEVGLDVGEAITDKEEGAGASKTSLLRLLHAVSFQQFHSLVVEL
ncbi:hypothetical protein BELL_0081g00120 [Botrytis elliptica]|uniref:Uncharacterized protein n=1 Tax=Botrytis elliptica TaxID=278938 RepID=A0A4Z1JVY0_9HELO|nr:hypothetical protein BELL_0081g00120 [Botrytis elliptica]